MTGSKAFSLSGDPNSIRTSSGKWSQFSSAASIAASDIRAIDSGDFVGDEADTYRHRLNQDLPPHLDTTSAAWSSVAGALQHYSATLESLQRRLSTLSAQAADQQSQVSSANDAVADAHTADARHTSSAEAAAKALPPGQQLPPDTYQLQTAGASSHLAAANAALQSTVDAANRVHQEHDAALDTCVNAINQAAGTRFQEPPGFWGRMKNSVTGWISEHADVLKSISSVLKTISGIAGLLAMIPVLSPIMGPIALATGGAALLIDVTVKVATGQGSWTGILVDGAMLALPGAGKLLKGAVMATKTGQAADRAATTALDLARNSKVGAAVTALKNSRAGSVLSAPAKGLDYVNTKVADGLSHVPGANRLPGVKTAIGDGKSGLNSAPVTKTPTVLRDGEGATPQQVAASTGGPTAGSRVGQSKARLRLLDDADGDYVCWRCGQRTSNPANVHLGHTITPVSKGGNLSPENTALEGAACNLSAGSRGAPSPGMSCVERGSAGAPYGRTD